MLRCTLLATIVFAALGTARHATAEDVLFEDNFDGTLSPKWQAVGLAKDDFRIRNNGLEMRVQPGRLTRDTPMLLVLLPFNTSESVVASVEVTPLDQFTEPGESAGLFLTDADSREFAAEKRNLDGHLVFSPANVEFIGEEGDPQQYALKFWPANEVDGPLRIIVREHYGHFQVGPSLKGKYLNFFHSALRENEPKRGFCLHPVAPQIGNTGYDSTISALFAIETHHGLHLSGSGVVSREIWVNFRRQPIPIVIRL